MKIRLTIIKQKKSRRNCGLGTAQITNKKKVGICEKLVQGCTVKIKKPLTNCRQKTHFPPDVGRRKSKVINVVIIESKNGNK